VEHGGVTEQIMVLALQLGVILFVAKIAGELTERYLKQPSVLGELVGGVIIGPFALGGMIHLPGLPHALFPLPLEGAELPVSTELWAVAQIAAIFLLFIAGLETDLTSFLKYAGPATFIAVGGVVFPFLLGQWGTVWMGYASSPMDAQALFMGAIMVATSVGITARVLSDIHKLDTPEGVTILGAAVVDDVIGIIILAVVIGLAATGEFDWGVAGRVFGKAVGFYLTFMIVGLAIAKYIAGFLGWFKSRGAAVALAVGFAFIAAAVAEMFGLAMIIGAYSMGLVLSDTKLSHYLEERVMELGNVFVPIFFVVLGMLVDVEAMMSALGFGLLISIFAIISKVFGCGIPALAVGFNTRGAARIGFGMLPRGEVALIVAGVGLAAGIIDSTIFGVSILMTMVTTLIAPVVLVPLFKSGGSGRRSDEAAADAS